MFTQDEPGGIVILDKELLKQLQLTTEDLRFADNISKRVDDTVAEGAFLEGTGTSTYLTRSAPLIQLQNQPVC